MRSDGVILRDYSEVSVRDYNKPDGPIKLYDTGSFYESFKVLVKGTTAKITAKTDWGDYDLAESYGIEIIGLTDESKEILTKIIKEVTTEKVREMLRIN